MLQPRKRDTCTQIASRMLLFTTLNRVKYLMSFDRDGFYREIGLLLQGMRKRRGLTQEQLAAALGVPRPTYANVEAGRQRVAVDLLWKAAVVLRVPLQKLVPEPVTDLPLWTDPPEGAGSESTSFAYMLPQESVRKSSGA